MSPQGGRCARRAHTVQGGHMLPRIIAGTAVAGALTLGVAGAAGAAASSSGTNTSTPTANPSAKVCGRLANIEARVQKFEAKVNARIPKAEAREAKLRSEGHTALA